MWLLNDVYAYIVLRLPDGLNQEIVLTIGNVAGDFWYNVTAENLHSDPEYGVIGKPSHGGCLIHLQKPINFHTVTTASKPQHIIGITEPNNGKFTMSLPNTHIFLRLSTPQLSQALMHIVFLYRWFYVRLDDR